MKFLTAEGKPYPDVNVEIKNSRFTGQINTAKTDKNGRFQQLGLLSGVYVFTLTNAKGFTSILRYSSACVRIRKTFNLNSKKWWQAVEAEK